MFVVDCKRLLSFAVGYNVDFLKIKTIQEIHLFCANYLVFLSPQMKSHIN